MVLADSDVASAVVSMRVRVREDPNCHGYCACHVAFARFILSPAQRSTAAVAGEWRDAVVRRGGGILRVPQVVH
jgi:hypothetical protein